MKKTITTTLYTLKELKGNKYAYDRAMTYMREGFNDVWTTVHAEVRYAFIKELEAKGWSDVETQYRGFYSQGDGASFTGTRYLKQEAAKHYYPSAEELTFKLRRISHHYAHENTVDCDYLEVLDAQGDVIDYALVEKVEDTLLEEARGEMHDYYDRLETAWESYDDDYFEQESEEQEVYFLEDGHHYDAE